MSDLNRWLGNIGMGLLSSNALSRNPQNPMQHIMQYQKQDMMNDREAQDRALRQAQFNLLLMKHRSEQNQLKKQSESYNQVRDTLTPAQLAVFNANPQGYVSKMQDNMFKEPEKINYNQPFLPDGTPNTAFQEYKADLAKNSAATTNNKISLPQNAQISGDYVISLDENNKPIMTVIPGSETDIKNRDAESRKGLSEDKTAQTAGLQVSTINDARNKIKENPALTSGFFGGMLSNFGGSDAKDVSALLDTVRANISFDYLQSMRNSSPTGGALGQVSERELALLGATAGSLDQSQSPEQLLETLDRLDRQFLEVIHGKEAADKIFKSRETSIDTAPQDATTEDLINIYG